MRDSQETAVAGNLHAHHGDGSREAVADKVSAPFAATLKVWIVPLLDAIRKWPSGVDRQRNTLSSNQG